MSLKPITLRLDEEEYEQLKKMLAEFADPDINVAYVLRCYIRDLNRALPLMTKSGVDLKSYLGLFGPWLKQFSSMMESDKYSRLIMNPWAMWGSPPAGPGASPEEVRRPAKTRGAQRQRQERSNGKK